MAKRGFAGWIIVRGVSKEYASFFIASWAAKPTTAPVKLPNPIAVKIVWNGPTVRAARHSR